MKASAKFLAELDEKEYQEWLGLRHAERAEIVYKIDNRNLATTEVKEWLTQLANPNRNMAGQHTDTSS